MWALAITVLLFALALALVKSHMHRLYGGYVAHADTTPFVTSPETLAITNVTVWGNSAEAAAGGSAHDLDIISGATVTIRTSPLDVNKRRSNSSQSGRQTWALGWAPLGPSANPGRIAWRFRRSGNGFNCKQI